MPCGRRDHLTAMKTGKARRGLSRCKQGPTKAAPTELGMRIKVPDAGRVRGGVQRYAPIESKIVIVR